jgi:hypothetical protein
MPPDTHGGAGTKASNGSSGFPCGGPVDGFEGASRFGAEYEPMSIQISPATEARLTAEASRSALFIGEASTTTSVEPRRVPKPRTAADALAAISGLLGLPEVLPVPAHTVYGLLDLLRRHPVMGGEVFDLQIIASMQANDVRRLFRNPRL